MFGNFGLVWFCLIWKGGHPFIRIKIPKENQKEDFMRRGKRDRRRIRSRGIQSPNVVPVKPSRVKKI